MRLGDLFQMRLESGPQKEKYEIDLKASSFRITAEGTEFDGEMIVTKDSDPTQDRMQGHERGRCLGKV